MGYEELVLVKVDNKSKVLTFERKFLGNNIGEYEKAHKKYLEELEIARLTGYKVEERTKKVVRWNIFIDGKDGNFELNTGNFVNDYENDYEFVEANDIEKCFYVKDIPDYLPEYRKNDLHKKYSLLVEDAKKIGYKIIKIESKTIIDYRKSTEEINRYLDEDNEIKELYN